VRVTRLSQLLARHSLFEIDYCSIDTEGAELAILSELDLERFRIDLADPDILQRLATDHQEARRKHGVFGTPTFVFTNGAAASGVKLHGCPLRPVGACLLDGTHDTPRA